MKEYKFRAWDRYHGEMINWEQYRSELVSDDFVNHGKDNVIWEVIFDKSEASFKLETKIEKKCGEEKYQDTIWNSVRAVIGNQMNKIGNIYENPELLES